jgi:hypothetical protein
MFMPARLLWFAVVGGHQSTLWFAVVGRRHSARFCGLLLLAEIARLGGLLWLADEDGLARQGPPGSRDHFMDRIRLPFPPLGVSGQIAAMPPSITSSAPVTKRDSSEIR